MGAWVVRVTWVRGFVVSVGGSDFGEGGVGQKMVWVAWTAWVRKVLAWFKKKLR